MGWIRDAAALFEKERKVLLRDRQALVLLFAMPAVFVVVLSVALQGVWSERTGGNLAVSVACVDSHPLARRVEALLRGRPEWRVVPPGSTDAKAAIEIPAGFGGDLEAYADDEGAVPFGAHKIVWRTDPVVDASTRWFVQASVALAVQEALLDELAATERSAPTPQHRRDASEFAAEATEPERRRIVPTPLQQTVPGWALFAMFFVAVPLSGGFIRERNDGSLRRVWTYPVAPSAVVAGKLGVYLLVNVAQFAAMLAAGLWIVPLLGPARLELGASPWHLVPVTLAAAAAATGFGVLVAALGRTAEQAGALAATTIIVMAVAGGVMVPVFVMPAAMQTVARLSPLYWGHQAYLDVLLRGAPLAAIAPKLGALAAFSGACALVAARTFRSQS